MWWITSILLSNDIRSFFHSAMDFRTVSMVTSFHLFWIASLRFCWFSTGSRRPSYTESCRISQMQWSKGLRSGEYDDHSPAAMKSGVFCHRNCCATFAWCDAALCLTWRRSHCPDKVNIQTVRKFSTRVRNGFGQILFSADQRKKHQFFHSKKLRHLPSAFLRIGISNGTAVLVKCHFFTN